VAEPESRPFEQPGAIVSDKYRVERTLGIGGMGVVVKATHLLLDEPVALKFLRPEYARDEEACLRFVREAKAALRIRGEHVANVLDVGRLPSGEPYMAMEYLEGSDMDALLARIGPLPIGDAVAAVVDACTALSAAHARGIVHRDIKPANLFLARDAGGNETVKVLDFGISKLMGERVDALTKTSTAMGSALYMSPEQLTSSKDVDARTDVYALGTTLYELLTGRLPFDGETMPQLVAAILTGTPRPLLQERSDVPAALADTIHRAIARDRDERHGDVAELSRELLPFASRSDDLTIGPPSARQQVDAVASAGTLPSHPGLTLPSHSGLTGLPPDDGVATTPRLPRAKPLPLQIGAETAAPTSSEAAEPAARRVPVVAALVAAGVVLVAFVVLVASSAPDEPAEPDRIAPAAAPTQASVPDDEPPTAGADPAASAPVASTSATTDPSTRASSAPAPRPTRKAGVPPTGRKNDIFKSWE
jgi:serine/threonine-protein kinase